MSKIIKLSFLLGFILSVSTANASTIMVCPTNINCSYDEGTCDQPDGWYINFFAGGPFTGTQNLTLSNIFGAKASAANIDPYDKIEKTKIECLYLPGGIKLVAYVQKLAGENWSFSGFGKYSGVCSDMADPTACAGEN
jgi:hypothetical protein